MFAALLFNQSRGSWFSKLWSLFSDSREYKIIIIGLDNAGKTTIMYRLLVGEVIDPVPTISTQHETIVYKNIRFYCIDIGGQHVLRQTWANYFADTDAVIYVVDSSDKERLVIAKEELEKVLKHETLESAVLLIFANKSDVKGSFTVAEISDALGLSEISSHQWHIQSCCALTSEGLTEGLEWIADRLSNSRS